MKIIPINEIGGSRMGSVYTTYQEICEKLGFTENVKDDPYKVEASWAFQDADTGREAFLWCYKIPKLQCKTWSADGDFSLLEDLFSSSVVVRGY